MHPHQTPFTQSRELNEVHGSRLEIFSNQIRLHCRRAVYVIKHILRTRRPMVQHKIISQDVKLHQGSTIFLGHFILGN